MSVSTFIAVDILYIITIKKNQQQPVNKLFFPDLFTEISTQEQRLSALQYLVALLPISNRDTLQSLLHFLAKVVQHSTDTIDIDGETVSFVYFKVVYYSFVL